MVKKKKSRFEKSWDKQSQFAIQQNFINMHYVCPEENRLCENLPISFYQELDSQSHHPPACRTFPRIHSGKRCSTSFQKVMFDVAFSPLKKYQKKSKTRPLRVALGNGMQAANVFTGVKCKILTCFFVFFSYMTFLPSFVGVQLPNLFQPHHPPIFSKRLSVDGS